MLGGALQMWELAKQYVLFSCLSCIQEGRTAHIQEGHGRRGQAALRGGLRYGRHRHDCCLGRAAGLHGYSKVLLLFCWQHMTEIKRRLLGARLE